jgi:hypothetical protein
MSQTSFTSLKLNWLEQVALDPNLLASALRVVALLCARYLNSTSGTAWPSEPRMAADIGMTDRGIRKAISSLAEAGHLKIERGRGRGNTNKYAPIVKTTNAGSPSEDQKRGTTVPVLEPEKGNGCSGFGDRKEEQTCQKRNGRSYESRIKNPVKEICRDASGLAPGMAIGKDPQSAPDFPGLVEDPRALLFSEGAGWLSHVTGRTPLP